MYHKFWQWHYICGHLYEIIDMIVISIHACRQILTASFFGLLLWYKLVPRKHVSVWFLVEASMDCSVSLKCLLDSLCYKVFSILNKTILQFFFLIFFMEEKDFVYIPWIYIFFPWKIEWQILINSLYINFRRILLIDVFRSTC